MHHYPPDSQNLNPKPVSERGMKGSSQVILGATLILAASLAIVLSLVLVLLAELYCSLLLRRWRGDQQHLSNLKGSAGSATLVTILSPSSSVNPSTPSPLSNFYAQGVLHAPRSVLFPALPSPDAAVKNYGLSGEALELSPTPHQIGLIDAAPPPSSFISLSNPSRIIQEECSFQFRPSTSSHPVYISNPVYDSDATDRANDQLPDMALETPSSTASCLESGSSSGADNERDDETRTWTRQEAEAPPLTPTKELPAQACSVPLRDAGSLYTSVSDSNNNHGLLSSFSSGTPCTSPSW